MPNSLALSPRWYAIEKMARSRGEAMTASSRSISAWVRNAGGGGVLRCWASDSLRWAERTARASRTACGVSVLGFEFNKTVILLHCGLVCDSKWLILGWDMRAGLFSNVAL